MISTFNKEEIRDVLKEEIKEESHEDLSVKEDVRHVIQKDEKSVKKSSEQTAPSRSVLIKKITSPLKKSTAPEYIPDLKPIKGVSVTSNIIVIGASVGGPRTITTILKEIPRTSLKFHYEVVYQHKKLVTIAEVELAFVDSDTRKPMPVPAIFIEKLEKVKKNVN